MPRLRIRKKTRAMLAGLAIAVTSLYALTVSYDISAEQLLAFFLTSLGLVLITMALAAALVATFRFLHWLFYGRKG